MPVYPLLRKRALPSRSRAEAYGLVVSDGSGVELPHIHLHQIATYRLLWRANATSLDTTSLDTTSLDATSLDATSIV